MTYFNDTYDECIVPEELYLTTNNEVENANKS